MVFEIKLIVAFGLRDAYLMCTMYSSAKWLLFGLSTPNGVCLVCPVDGWFICFQVKKFNSKKKKKLKPDDSRFTVNSVHRSVCAYAHNC